MMEKYLPEDYTLKFPGHPGEYTVVRVLGEGASAVTYLTEYRDGSGERSERIIKEYFPDGLNTERGEDGRLQLAEKDREKYARGKEQFRAGGVRQNELRYKTSLKNETPPLQGIYEQNNTLYLEVTPFAGKTYDRFEALSLPERVKICLAAAKLVRQYHRLGYLCLDLKPENIFVLTNSSDEIVTDLIEFVDFDSIRSKEEIAAGYPLSFTKSWSAPEQNNPYAYRKISERTDVYAVGELVFWSVFGRHSKEEEHRGFSAYPYDTGRESFAKIADRTEIRNLFTKLFRNTLRSSPENRYASMDDVICVLEKIAVELSRKEYVITSALTPPPFFVGREREMREIEEHLAKEHILFVCGIGGIGKSTLVQNFCAQNVGNYDLIIYLSCAAGLQSAFIDDTQFHIHTVSKREEESGEEYFSRKLRHLEDLSFEKKVLFVLDDYRQAASEEFKLFTKQHWKIIVISRRFPPCCSYQVQYVDAISGREQLYRLFGLNLGREISGDEEADVGYMIEKAGGHTLTVGLIARQIANSYLSVSEAAKLADKYGFSHIAPEKVGYVKDEKEEQDTIAGIITALFDAAALSVDKRIILKFLSLFPASGVSVKSVQRLLDLPSKDGFNELDREGWAYLDAGKMRLHPVIAETIRLWQWEDAYGEAVSSAMKKLLREVKDGEKKRKQEKGHGSEPKDREEEKESCRLAEELLDGCKKEDRLCNSGIYRNLLYCTVTAMPRHREDYIIENTAGLLAWEDAGNERAVLRLYDDLVTIYAERRNFDTCDEILERVKSFLEKHPDHYAKAMYYGMLATYYDARLDGAYDWETAEEQEMLGLLMDALNRACRHIRLSRWRGGKKLLAGWLLSKACILTRSTPEKKKEIDRVFSSAKRLIDENISSDFEIRCDYQMSRAWYYTLVKPDFHRTVLSVREARRLAGHTGQTELDMIDRIIIPAANMFFEWEEYERAKKWICAGIRVCDDYADILPYVRKKTELMRCMRDINEYGGGRGDLER